MATIARPYDSGQFWRLGATRFSIAVGTIRSSTVGFKPSEGWASASGRFVFSISPSFLYAGTYRDTYRDVYRRDADQWAVMAVAAPAWQAHKNDSDAILTAAVNRALAAAGYARGDGSTIGS